MDAAHKKHTLRLLHHNVAIVSAGKGEATVGATVTWFSQSSFEPPLVMFAIKADSQLYQAITAENTLVASLVTSGDKATAGSFFKAQTWDQGRFGGLAAKPHALGGAILENSPAWFAAEVRELVPQGDHHVIVAEVVDAGVNDDKQTAMCLSETGWNYGG